MDVFSRRDAKLSRRQETMGLAPLHLRDFARKGSSTFTDADIVTRLRPGGALGSSELTREPKREERAGHGKVHFLRDCPEANGQQTCL
jgi:hypothetical protein